MRRRVQEAFDQIHAEQGLQNRTMEFLANRTDGYRKRSVVPHKWLAAAAACLVLLLSAGVGYSAYLTPVYAICIDINPSIELGINRFNRVVAVDTYNEDGYAVMSAMDVYYLEYTDALKRILTDHGMEEYILQNPFIAVTVYGRNEKKSNELLDDVAACTSSYANVRCSSGSAREVAEAHEAGLSFGKYKAFLELQALVPDITVEDIQELTACQIWDLIEELSEDDSRNRNDGTDRCGRGLHNGYGRGKGSCWQGMGNK